MFDAVRATGHSRLDFYSAAVAVMVGGFMLLAFGFSQGPIFEGPDEIEHFRYIQTLVHTGQLPPPDGKQGGEYHQPPLYYLLNAPLLSRLSDDGFELINGHRNPFYPQEIGIPSNDNKNLYLHTRATETSPVAQAVHLLRLLPLLFGVLTLLICERLFSRVFQQKAVRLTALAIVAFHPQFAYLSAVINNDSLLILLATGVLFLLVDGHQRGLTGRRALLLGLLCGALLITKISSLFVGLAVAAVFVSHRGWWRWLPLTAFTVIVVAGGWYARNTLIYHDPLMTEALRQTWPGDYIENRAAAWGIGLRRLPFIYETFWARFGGGAVGVPPQLQMLWNGLVIAALGGGVLTLWRVRRRRVHADSMLGLIVLIFGLCWLGAAFYRAITAWSGVQGRYLLPAEAVWAILLAGGGLAWFPGRWRGVAGGLLSTGLGVMAAIALIGFFLPAYRPLPAMIGNLTPQHYQYEGVAELIDSQISTISAAPDTIFYVTLTWRALSTPAQPLLVYVHSILPEGAPAQRYIGRDSTPGTGNFLAEDWQAGDTWSERYVIRVADNAPRQTRYTLVAGLSEQATDRPLDSVDSEGGEVLPVIGQIAVPGAQDIPLNAVYHFGEHIGLERPGLDIGDQAVQICLPWRALADGEADYVAFVHIFDAEGDLLAQRDSQPLEGRYPTGYWRQGERIRDCVTLDADPAAVTTIAFGLYDPATQTRLPVTDVAAARLLPDGQVILAAR